MSRVHSAAPRPYSVSLASANGLVGVARANDRGHRAEGLLAERGHVGVDAVQDGRRVEVALAVDGAAADQRAARPARPSARPGRPARRAGRRAPAGRRWCRAAAGRRRAAPRPRRRTSASNSSATDSSTMKRLAAMQLWPLFWLRARTAVGRGGVQVGVGQDDERVRAAQLEHLLLRAAGRRRWRPARRPRSSRSG